MARLISPAVNDFSMFLPVCPVSVRLERNKEEERNAGPIADEQAEQGNLLVARIINICPARAQPAVGPVTNKIHTK